MRNHHFDFSPAFIFKMRRKYPASNSRGQSFVELSLVVLFLGLVLAGVVEFGFLLNQYLHVLDAAREAARYSSNNVPFIMNADGTIHDLYSPPFYYLTAIKAAEVMKPVVMNPPNPDDIVVSVFSVNGNHVVRFPSNDPTGWSLCAHFNANIDDSAVVYPDNPPTACTGAPYGGFASYFGCVGATIPDELSDPDWATSCTVHQSQMNNAFILNHMNPSAPNSGVLVVEIYYNYPQLLKLPVLTTVLPDPIPVYVYSVMPLSSAEPTQVP